MTNPEHVDVVWRFFCHYNITLCSVERKAAMTEWNAKAEVLHKEHSTAGRTGIENEGVVETQ